jgi:antitoxin PrlF
MANTAFNGSITTSGSSQAICVEKAFFRSFPEFHQKAKVRAKVISHGQVLISVVEEAPSAQLEDDPVVEAFLGFLAEDMQANPKRLAPLSQSAMDRVQKLTKDVVVDDNEVLPDDISF